MPLHSTFNAERDEHFSLHKFERRKTRYLRLFWSLAIPTVFIALAGAAIDLFLESLILVLVGLLMLLLVMFREALDMLGFLGSNQHTLIRQQEALRRELAAAQQHKDE